MPVRLPRLIAACVLIHCFLLAPAAGWRTSEAEQLPSFGRPELTPLDEIERFDLPPLDVNALFADDAADEAATLTKPRRVGEPRKVALSPTGFGTWEDLGGGGRLWRGRVRSPGALWLVLEMTTFRVPDGAQLFIYDPQLVTIQGPFGAADVRDHGQLWSTPVLGDTAVVELFWPARWKEVEPNLHLGLVSHGYRPWGGIGRDDPGLDAGACNIDINCPLGDDWQDEKRGVVLTLVGGSRDCTGSLIAQAGGEDCRTYMLTAHHCHGNPSEATSMSLMFNFERPVCDSGIAPTDQVLGGGGVQRATFSSTDFTLIEMTNPPPPAFQPYWNGWSRSPSPATATWGIHHPSNDEKKICFNDDTVINGSNWGTDHWRVTEWEQGTTEGGSSGSPLFDQNSRIVGQLHGGSASCSSNTWDEYGKLSDSWEGGGTASSRLRDWLDPNGTGEETIDGTYGPVCGAPAPSLSVAGTSIDDSAGNNDGVVDVDESFKLLVDVENRGSLDATSVSGTLTTTTPDVTIVDGAASWPDIPVGQLRTSDAPHFELRTEAAFVCGTVIDLELSLTAAERPEGWVRQLAVATGTPNVTTLFEDDMESGTGSWTTQSLAGTGPWQQSNSQSKSPTTSWFVADPPTIKDQALVMESIGPLAANDELTFQHRLNTEGGYDGGVLEYRIGTGPWTDTGPLIVEGAYNSTINTCCGNPLGGREGWSGDNGGFTPVRVDLSSLAGNTVQFRWRFASDDSVSDVGWYVDDVAVRNTEFDCSPVIVVPGEASGFTVDKDPGGYLLQWSAPGSGAAVNDYVLYRTGLGGYAPTCEANLGTGTSAVLATLPDDHAFVVVARNGNGEGSYGTDSEGADRPVAGGADVCP